MATMQEIESHSQAYAKARTELTNVVTLLNAEIEAAKRRRMDKLKKAIAAATATGDALLDAVKESADLFVKPKSAILHGIKVGFKKEKGKIVITDDAQTIKLIRKNFPELEDVLIATTEKPSKEGINTLKADQLKKIGVTVTSDTDMAFISDPSSDIDKIVNALLKGVEEEAEVAA